MMLDAGFVDDTVLADGKAAVLFVILVSRLMHLSEHLSVCQNVAYCARRRHITASERDCCRNENGASCLFIDNHPVGGCVVWLTVP